MAVGSTRKGVTQAKFNDDASNFVFAEIGILSGVVGYYFSDWYIFGGMLVGLIICLYIPIINIIMGVGLSVLWALIGAKITCFFQDTNIPNLTNTFEYADIYNVLVVLFSTPPSQIIGGLLFLASLGAHLATIEWTRDIADLEDRNF